MNSQLREHDYDDFDLTQLAGDEATNIGESIPGVDLKPAIPSMDVWGYLKRRDGAQELQLRHRIVDGKRDTYYLGRSQVFCDIVVDFKNVSKKHCSIYCDFSGARMKVYVQGLSSNGTYINHGYVRVVEQQQYELKTGDDIFLVNPVTATPEVIAKTCFMFVNLHERLAFHREVAPAPPLPPKSSLVDSSSLPSSSASTHVATNSTASSCYSSDLMSVCAPKVRLVEEFYIIGEQIGSGMCGQVHLCVQKATGVYFVSVHVALLFICKCAFLMVTLLFRL